MILKDSAFRQPRPAFDKFESTVPRFLVILAIFFLAMAAGTPEITGKLFLPTATSPATAPAEDVDFGPYMDRLQKRIKRRWFPPQGNESKRIVVLFKILMDGKLGKLSVINSSGVAIADKAALKAVADSFPMPLPAGAKEPVDVQFTFDYNVFYHGQGHSQPQTSQSGKADSSQ